MNLPPVDMAVIAAYMAVIAGIMVRTRKFAGKNLDNFFVGGRFFDTAVFSLLHRG